MEPIHTAFKELVLEQLALGYLEPLTSRCNTLSFVLEKKSEKYWLLQDLRVINEHIKKAGTTQAGLLHPSANLNRYHVMILNIKYYFFQIPLDPQHGCCFAFTVWDPNINKAAKRYQWTVLPQGMKHILTICQL